VKLAREGEGGLQSYLRNVFGLAGLAPDYKKLLGRFERMLEKYGPTRECREASDSAVGISKPQPRTPEPRTETGIHPYEICSTQAVDCPKYKMDSRRGPEIQGRRTKVAEIPQGARKPVKTLSLDRRKKSSGFVNANFGGLNFHQGRAERGSVENRDGREVPVLDSQLPDVSFLPPATPACARCPPTVVRE